LPESDYDSVSIAGINEALGELDGLLSRNGVEEITVARVLRLNEYTGVDGIRLDDIPVAQPGDGEILIVYFTLATNMDLSFDSISGSKPVV
jgi:hypothetical protein